MKPLFPTNLKPLAWQTFKAAGFRKPVTGMLFPEDKPAKNGMPLGGIDTGCLDLESNGLLGYISAFNSLTPRRGPLNVPYLGFTVDGHGAYVCAAQGMPGVTPASRTRYWGHYPIADAEFTFDGPIQAGVRAWTPFLPGDLRNSMIPGAVFEVHLRNTSRKAQQGKLSFSFPGFDRSEVRFAPIKRFRFNGTGIAGAAAIGHGGAVGPTMPQDAATSGYALGILGARTVTWSEGFGWDASRWQAMGCGAEPMLEEHDTSAMALTVDWKLAAGAEKTVRVVLSWYAPVWYGGGSRLAGGNAYTHMYAKHFTNAVEVAEFLAANHASLLRRILAWQSVVYAEPSLPDWLQDSLINVLHLITETGAWAQAKPPVGDWCQEEDGVWGMNECPRSCPQMECIPCSFYGNLPVTYFFPHLVQSNLRAQKAYQFEDGRASWVYGGFTTGTGPWEMALPAKGYQTSLNGFCLVEMVHKLWLTRGDDAVLAEFYDMCKRATIFTMTLSDGDLGRQVVAAPGREDGQDWYESIPITGYAVHAGGVHLAQLRLMIAMATARGDTAFQQRCQAWLDAGMQAIEANLWTGGYYLFFHEPTTGQRCDFVHAFQLDGEWIARFHGQQGVFRPDRVATTLDTVKRLNRNPATAPYGTRLFTKPDGSKTDPGTTGYWQNTSTHTPGDMILAMTHLYAGQREEGLAILKRCLETVTRELRATWDFPIMVQTDTAQVGFGNDYYQNLILWSVPAALAGTDLARPCREGGLVARLIAAGAA